MPMSYQESAALMTDPAFRGRVKVAALNFANSISIESPDVPAHNARQRWANVCVQNPEQTAAQLTPPTVIDPAVQQAGAQISDQALQLAVETTVNKIL